MPPSPATATRRTALGAGVAGLVTGCSVLQGDDAVPTAPGTTPTEPTEPAVDADQVLVDGVVTRVSEALATVAAARRETPRLRRELRGLERLHVAHLTELGVDDPAPDRPEQPAARTQVLAEEVRVQRYLADAAVRAESGALASLLASMSAGVAQHLAVL